jgi:hypothetical protein
MNLFNGTGILYFKNGGFYNGTWLSNQKNGQGKNVYTNGDIYEGSWLRNECHGFGVLRFVGISPNQGDRYEGLFAGGRFNGNGIYYYKNGGFYNGSFLNSVKNGELVFYS